MTSSSSLGRSALRATGGFVLLTSIVLPGTAAHAADAPVTKPAGWVGSSVGAFDPNMHGDKQWYSDDWMTFHDYSTDPEVDPVHLDLFYSTDQVRQIGDRVDFLVSLRRIEDYVPRPVEAPGVKGKVRKAVYGTLDLRTLVDDVEALALTDFVPEDGDAGLLRLTWDGGQMHFSADFPAGREVVTFRFSAVYAGTGDRAMTPSVTAQFSGTHYGTDVSGRAPIRVVEPPLEIVKRGSTAQVTALGEEVTYSIDVVRPAENSSRTFTMTDDFSGLADDVDAFNASAVRVDGAPVGPGEVSMDASADAFTYAGSFGPSGTRETRTISYTVRYAGSGDGSLVNRACVVGDSPLVADPAAQVCDQVRTPAQVPTASPTSTPTASPTSTASPSASASASPDPSPSTGPSTAPSAGASTTPDGSGPAPGPAADPHSGDSLPQTGGPALGLVALGAAAVVAGTATTAASVRRRRRA